MQVTSVSTYLIQLWVPLHASLQEAPIFILVLFFWKVVFRSKMPSISFIIALALLATDIIASPTPLGSRILHEKRDNRLNCGLNARSSTAT